MNTVFVGSLFILTIGIARIIELFWLERNKLPGKICAGWTLSVLSVGYALVLISTLLEFIIVRRAIDPRVSVAGLMVIILRMPIKFWAAKTLDQYWSPQIEIRDGHQLIKKGPYKYMRHPAYFSAIIDLFAVPLLLNSYYSLFSVSLLLLGAIMLRMKIEEEALVAKFGDEYIKYKNETFALLPIRKIKI